MTGQPQHVLVVGAGLGGLRTVERLRSTGYQGRISLVGDEPHLPYDRPPLSKQVLTGDWPSERSQLRTAVQLADLGVRLHLGVAATALHPGEIELSDGASLHADAIVVATGLAARRLPGQPAAAHTLRTLDDALALRAALGRAGSVLVVGGGFIGAEVASAALRAGAAVTVLETLPVVCARALGPELGALAGRLMTDAGVDLRTGAVIAAFAEDDGRIAVTLGGGERLDADLAVVGIGGVPRLEWISGVDTSAGLLCGPTGRVRGLEQVWAVGDAATWTDARTGRAYRHEHWTSAGDQAAVVARDILGAPPPPPSVPYFWSDQFGLKIQLLGRTEGTEELLPLHGEGLRGGAVRGTVAGLLDGDRLVGVAGFGAARLVSRYRSLVAEGADAAAARELAASL